MSSMHDDGRATRPTVVIAKGTIDIAAAVQNATAAAAAGRCVIVAGIVFNAGRWPRKWKHWQFSLSPWGQPPIPVSRHHYLRDAEAQARRVLAATHRRDLCDGGTFAAFIQELAVFGDREASEQRAGAVDG